MSKKKKSDTSKSKSDEDASQNYIQTLKDGGVVDFNNETFRTHEIQLSKLSIKYETRSIEESVELMKDVFIVLINNNEEISSMTELNFANWLEKKLVKLKEDKKIFNYYEITNHEIIKESD